MSKPVILIAAAVFAVLANPALASVASPGHDTVASDTAGLGSILNLLGGLGISPGGAEPNDGSPATNGGGHT